jgi:enoyl-CoA hydratase/carnithine racemase
MSKPNSSYSTLTLAYDGAIAVVTLNRPEKRNAISYELIDDVLGALSEVEQSSAQSLLFGDGPRQPAFDHWTHRRGEPN